VWGGSLPPSSACSNASMSTRSDGFKLPADLSLSGDGSAGTRGSGGSSFNPPHPAIPPGLLATHPAMQSSSMQNRPYLDSGAACFQCCAVLCCAVLRYAASSALCLSCVLWSHFCCNASDNPSIPRMCACCASQPRPC
jgi:hypothetical protein